MEALHQARFADARFADDQRHLALAIEHALPSIHQQAQFVLAPDERRQSTRSRGRFEPPAHSARLDYAVEPDRPFDAFERLRAALFDHEQPRDQPMRRIGDHHRARLRRRLHPRGDIGRVAEDVGVLARARANHHRARIDADPRRQLRVRRMFVELRDRVEDREARAGGAFGVVVVRLGPAEIGHHPVAEILRDVAAEAGDRFRRRAMVPGDDLAPFLGIELRRDRGRADQVAEQHRQMPPLATGAGAR